MSGVIVAAVATACVLFTVLRTSMSEKVLERKNAPAEKTKPQD